MSLSSALNRSSTAGTLLLSEGLRCPDEDAEESRDCVDHREGAAPRTAACSPAVRYSANGRLYERNREGFLPTPDLVTPKGRGVPPSGCDLRWAGLSYRCPNTARLAFEQNALR